MSLTGDEPTGRYFQEFFRSDGGGTLVPIGTPNDRFVRLLHRCVLDFEAESRVPFDPQYVVNRLLTRSPGSAPMDDVYDMISFYLRGGHDVEYLLQKSLTPMYAAQLRRLIRMYGLTTNATSPISITLFRVASSFPAITCSKLLDAPNLLISKNVLRTFVGRSVGDSYPVVMMDLAFAFIIPRRPYRYCRHLRRAHMMYRYVLYYLSRPPASGPPVEGTLIKQCIRHTRLAVNSMHLSFDVQFYFLFANNLVSVVDSEVVASDAVREAADVWKNIIRKRDTLTQLIDDVSSVDDLEDSRNDFI